MNYHVFQKEIVNLCFPQKEKKKEAKKIKSKRVFKVKETNLSQEGKNARGKRDSLKSH